MFSPLNLVHTDTSTLCNNVRWCAMDIFCELLRWCECCYFKRQVTVVVFFGVVAISCDNDDTALFRQASLTHTHTYTQSRSTNLEKYAVTDIGAQVQLCAHSTNWIGLLLVFNQSDICVYAMARNCPQKKIEGDKRYAGAHGFQFESIWLLQKRQNISHYHQSLCVCLLQNTHRTLTSSTHTHAHTRRH